MTNCDDANRDRASQLANRLMDLSLLAIFLLAPLVLGGRHPVGRLALMVATLPGCAGMVLKLLSGRSLPLSRIQLLLLSACVLIPVVQVAPLSSQWVDRAAPGIEKMFADDAPLVSQSRLHSHFSISAATTRRSIPLVVTYVCIFVMLSCRLDTRADVERLLSLMMVSGLMLATLSLVQAHWGNGHFLWFYDHPSRDPGTTPRGPFQNENHLSSLLATTLPVVLYFLFRMVPASKSAHRLPSQRRASAAPAEVWRERLQSTDYRRLLAAIAGVVMVCTVYATPSRGGALLVACSAAAWLGCLAWRWLGAQYVQRISMPTWLALGTAGCLLVLAVALVGLWQQIERFSYWRAKIWAVDLAIWKDFPLLGIGVGNHGNVYRAYLDEYFPMTFSTGESSWLQLLVETGVVGFGLAIAMVAIVLGTLLRVFSGRHHRAEPALVGAVLAGLVASCLHAIGDFPWHIPACFVVVLALAAIAMRLPGVCRREALAGSTEGGLLSGASVLIAGLLMMGNLWAISQALPSAQAAQSWDRYRRLTRDRPEESPEVGHVEELSLLRQTLAYDPYHPLARIKLTHYLTAELERQRFQANSSEPLAKLILTQAATVATICPTESRSYLYAATALATLGAPVEQQQRLLAQSQRLRSVDGRVALRMGLNAMMLQDEAEVQRQFGIALDDDPSCRPHIVQTLLMLYSFEDVVQRWNPSRDTSAELYLQSRQRGSAESVRIVGQHYSQRLLEDAARAENLTVVDHLLDAAFTVAGEIEDVSLQLQIATQRVGLEPRNVTLRLQRAKLYARVGALSQAHADLQQARQTAPHDQRVRKLALQLDQATKSLQR